MYQKPDFVKVSVKVKDVFANYIQTGCIKDEGAVVLQNSGDACLPFDGTFMDLGWDHQCYSTEIK